ncbi:MAG: SDR family NAD(P)-dependent oxidoreductase [Anaerolineae bacterium]
MKLKDRIAIVTGGGRGIGRAIALAYAREGAHVVVAALTANEIEAVAEEVRGLDRRALAVLTDVADPAQVERMVQRTLDEFGAVDILVNNAGVVYVEPVVDMPLAHFDLIMDVNLRAAFVACKAVLPTMIERRRGRIINISSESGKFGAPRYAAYCASKFALNGFTESLALEVMKYGIRVNAVSPGAVDTRMARGPKEEAGTAERMAGWMQPEDIAGAAVFLASDEADMVIGACLEVFGIVRPGWNLGD